MLASGAVPALGGGGDPRRKASPVREVAGERAAQHRHDSSRLRVFWRHRGRGKIVGRIARPARRGGCRRGAAKGEDTLGPLLWSVREATMGGILARVKGGAGDKWEQIKQRVVQELRDRWIIEDPNFVKLTADELEELRVYTVRRLSSSTSPPTPTTNRRMLTADLRSTSRPTSSCGCTDGFSGTWRTGTQRSAQRADPGPSRGRSCSQ